MEAMFLFEISKKEMKKRKNNIKITKSFLNLLRSGQRNCIFLD